MGVKSQTWISIGLIIVLELFLLLTVSLTLVGIGNDRSWDRIMEGELKFPVDSGFFENKSMVLEVPEWAEEKSLMTRPLVSLTVFVVLAFLLKFMAAGHAIILVCARQSLRGRRMKLGVMILYLVAGGGMFIGAVLAAVSTSKVGDNSVQVMTVFYARVQRDAEDTAPQRQDYATTPMESLDEALLLMDIFGICMGGSLHSTMNPAGADTFPLSPLKEIRLLQDDNVYDKETLTRLHFCQLEGHKVAGVIFGLLSVLLCFGLAGLTANWLRNSLKNKKIRRRLVSSGSGDNLDLVSVGTSSSTLVIHADPLKVKDKAKVEKKVIQQQEELEEEEESAISGVSSQGVKSTLVRREGGFGTQGQFQGGQSQLQHGQGQFQAPILAPPPQFRSQFQDEYQTQVQGQYPGQFQAPPQFQGHYQGQGQAETSVGIRVGLAQGSLSTALGGSSGSGEFTLLATSSNGDLGVAVAGGNRVHIKMRRTSSGSSVELSGSGSGSGNHPEAGSSSNSRPRRQSGADEETESSPGWQVFI